MLPDLLAGLHDGLEMNVVLLGDVEENTDHRETVHLVVCRLDIRIVCVVVDQVHLQGMSPAVNCVLRPEVRVIAPVKMKLLDFKTTREPGS